MRIYLDNCCFNRPYDDQTQLRISLEAQAKLYIQNLIKNNKIQLVSSFILSTENDANPHTSRRNAINIFIENHANVFVSANQLDKIKEMALPIMATGIKQAGAFHLACALFANCDYFITTDKRILKYQNDMLKVQNPMTFLTELEE